MVAANTKEELSFQPDWREGQAVFQSNWYLYSLGEDESPGI